MHPPPLRVGSVPYVVGRPLDLGLEHEPGIEYTREVPAELVEGLRSGRLDVALVSTIELFRRPGYRYLERLVVAGRGAVVSVQAYLRRPLAQARTIALDPASRTSAALLAALFADEPGGGPRLLEIPSGEDPREAAADGWLRIGDRALVEHYEPAAPHVFNPSAAFCARTRLPFVFAAWIVRPGAAIEPHLPSFLRSRERGARAVEALAREHAARLGLPPEGMLHYLRDQCVFEVEGELEPALRAFRDLAARAGACPAEHFPRAVPLTSAHVPTHPR